MAESNQPAETTAQRLAKAYLQVFGAGDRERSADQRLVWRDIESFCHAYRLNPEVLTDGEYSANNMLVNEGRRSYWLRARGQILVATEPPAPPLTVSRKRKSAKP
jgi:hypothetical protein